MARVVALPLVAPIAEVVEDISCKEILCLGPRRRPVHCRHIHDVADFDHASLWIDSHKREMPDRAAGGIVEDGEKLRID